MEAGDRFFRQAMNDITVPSIVRDALVGALRSELCLLAILHARVGGSTEPWLMRALVERFEQGMRVQLRMLASIPGVSVDEGLLPAEDRIDLVATIQESEAFRQRLDVAYQEVANSDEGRFAPFGEPTLDD